MDWALRSNGLGAQQESPGQRASAFRGYGAGRILGRRLTLAEARRLGSKLRW
ncbi:MAG: hypothetical protein ACUVXG_11475 [Anaerolineae bacterium]